MPETLFVDTGYIVALINEKDQHHKEALQLSKQYDGYPLVITDIVLLEIGNALSRIARSEAGQIIEHFQQSDEVTLAHMTPASFQAAFDMYKAYNDKTWGLVDCHSFITMQNMGIQSVLGFDHHFEQVGFQLLKG